MNVHVDSGNWIRDAKVFWLYGGLLALPSLIYALRTLARARRADAGSTVPVLAVCLSGLALAFTVSWPILAYPDYAKWRAAARRQLCRANLRFLSMAMAMYAADNSDTLPRADNWSDAVADYVSSQ